MAAYLLRRLALSLPTIAGISLLVFLLAHLVPGDIVDVMLGAMRTPEKVAQLRALFGLDRPLSVQFALWLKDAMRGDLGNSLYTGRSVMQEITAVLPPTAQLAAASIAVSVLVAVPAGVLAAVRQYSLPDRIVTLCALVGTSMPVFWTGTLLILLLSVQLNWLPSGGYADFWRAPWQGVRHLILPAVALGLSSAAVLMRITRSSMLEVLRQEYIRVAQAKGLSDPVVWTRHALRNALIPLLTVLGVQMGFLLGGSVVVEEVFVRPGIGRLMLMSISQRDYPVIQGITLFFCLVFVLLNLVVDILYAWIDPRIRYG
ncbi:MAG: ABC transporter permease [Armatimonadetes bacterium]|nr:ABC transporter permease [Armatimonadota bacterium]